MMNLLIQRNNKWRVAQNRKYLVAFYFNYFDTRKKVGLCCNIKLSMCVCVRVCVCVCVYVCACACVMDEK